MIGCRASRYPLFPQTREEWGCFAVVRLTESAGRIAAHVAQLVEHILGKDEVSGSIPLMGSTKSPVGNLLITEPPELTGS